jgi:hypothetical protein
MDLVSAQLNGAQEPASRLLPRGQAGGPGLEQLVRTPCSNNSKHPVGRRRHSGGCHGFLHRSDSVLRASHSGSVVLHTYWLYR